MHSSRLAAGGLVVRLQEQLHAVSPASASCSASRQRSGWRNWCTTAAAQHIADAAFVWSLSACLACAVGEGVPAPNSKVLVSGSYDTTVRFWDLNTFRCMRKCDGHNDAVRVLAAYSGRVFSGSYDGTIGVRGATGCALGLQQGSGPQAQRWSHSICCRPGLQPC